MLSKIVSSFSLFLCLCGVCFATGYKELQQQFQAANSRTAKVKVLEQFAEDNPELGQHDSALLQQIVTAKNNPGTFNTDTIETMIDLRVATMSQGGPATDDVESRIKSIKSSPLYKDTGTENGQNWLSRAFSRLFSMRAPEATAPKVEPPKLPNIQGPEMGGFFGWLNGIGGIGGLFIYLLIGLLIAAVIFFLVLAFRHFSWKKTLKRKSSALLEEDEPERSADEWLRLAEGLSLQGRYREAVRCLYLACLLRIDEAKVARFIRSETNWEHLARIQASAKRPASLDMLAPTQAFDQIWYGHRVRGESDVDQFKIWYEDVVASLRAAEVAA